MTHIGLDHRLTYYRQGGISTYITRLTQALSKLDQHNRYTVLYSRKQADFHAPSNMQAVPLWTPCHHRFERSLLSLELTRLRLDVLHSTDFIPPYRGARRQVASIHDLTFLRYPEHLTAESRRYYNDQIEYAVRHADHILTISESSKQDLVSMLGVPENKITVQLLGVDPDFKIPSSENIAYWRKTLNLPASYWLFLGTFEPRKNIIGLLEAYKMVSARMENAPPLLLAGTRGWMYEETLTRIKTLNLEKQVQLIEHAPLTALPTLYHQSLAIVTPSFYEGFGLPALEGMACGTVPIVSNRSSLPEVVGDVGIQVEPENSEQIAQAMLKAYHDHSWRARQVEAGLQRASTFTWEKTARVAIKVYEAIA